MTITDQLVEAARTTQEENERLKAKMSEMQRLILALCDVVEMQRLQLRSTVDEMARINDEASSAMEADDNARKRAGDLRAELISIMEGE